MTRHFILRPSFSTHVDGLRHFSVSSVFIFPSSFVHWLIRSYTPPRLMTESSRKLVVVAGGTGGIGRHVVDGILAAKKHSLMVFTRQDPSSVPELTAKGAEVVKVDYSDHRSLAQHLQGIHTVIVTLISTDEPYTDSQVNLLNACLEAKVK
jgi:hypothetical protein